MPNGAEDNFQGVIDVVSSTAVIWDNENLGATYKVHPLDEAPIDDALKAKAKDVREELVETAVEVLPISSVTRLFPTHWVQR